MQKAKNGATLYKQVAKQIKQDILQGVYQKGDILPGEMTLASTMGVSRITIREALRLLNEVGIIETKRGKGSFVRMDVSDLSQGGRVNAEIARTYEYASAVRLLIEPAIAQAAALTASDEDLKKIAKTVETGPYRDNFHRSIIQSLHNPVLLKMMGDLFKLLEDVSMTSILDPVRQKHMSATLQRQHQKICEAITSRNAEFAYLYMKEHTMYVRKAYQEYFEAFYPAQEEPLYSGQL